MESFNDFNRLIEEHREIEFTIDGKRYSVTYGKNKNGTEFISFCKFYKPDIEFYSAKDFMDNARIGNCLLSDLWAEAKDIIVF